MNANATVASKLGVVIEAGSDQTYAEHSTLLVLQCLKN